MIGIPTLVDKRHETVTPTKVGVQCFALNINRFRKALDSDLRRNDEIIAHFALVFPPTGTFSAPC